MQHESEVMAGTYDSSSAICAVVRSTCTRAGASAVLPNRQRASEGDGDGDLVVLVTWDGLRQKD